MGRITWLTSIICVHILIQNDFANSGWIQFLQPLVQSYDKTGRKLILNAFRYFKAIDCVVIEDKIEPENAGYKEVVLPKYKETC